MSENTQLWTIPTFNFKIEIEDVGTMAFKEISGLTTEYEVIEYRQGNNPHFTNIKMPGLKKHGNVTLKKGIFASEKRIWDWIAEKEQNTIVCRSVTISLLDENQSPLRTWMLTNAWPIKIVGVNLSAEEENVALETLELAYEDITTVE